MNHITLLAQIQKKESWGEEGLRSKWKKRKQAFSLSQFHGSLWSSGMFVSDVSISLWDGAKTGAVTHLLPVSVCSYGLILTS